MNDHAKVFVEGAKMARDNARNWRRQAWLYPRYAENDLREANTCYQRGLGYLKTARQLRETQ